ncbi:hypothetical protein [Aestuariivirga sp.]|uniref:hypothetical protein n=1 Tax=Aestuariivirga sp. TaxID=2650926 RepID=UPI003BAC80C5
MSRYDTFEYEDISPESKSNIRAIAQLSNQEVEELLDLVKKNVARGNRRYLEALSHVYELLAKAMCDRFVRNALKRHMTDLREWKTSAKLVNCVVRNIMGVSRQMASKYAAVFDCAFEQNIVPSELIAFVKDNGGIEKIYIGVAKRRKIKSGAGERPLLSKAKSKSKKFETPAQHEVGLTTVSADLEQGPRKRVFENEHPVASIGDVVSFGSRKGVQVSSTADEWMVEVCNTMRLLGDLAVKERTPKLILIGFRASKHGTISVKLSIANCKWKEALKTL